MELIYRAVGFMKRNFEIMREKILRAGLKAFAERGFAGASVQEIVDAARVTKPVLYYYFKSKTGLYQALLDQASDECYQRVKTAAESVTGLEAQLVEILTALFDFLKQRRDLLRLAFSAAFASPGELPARLKGREQGSRNFDFIHGLIKAGKAAGNLDEKLPSVDLANGIYGALCFHLMIGALKSEVTMNRETAKGIVGLFLHGAAARKRNKGEL